MDSFSDIYRMVDDHIKTLIDKENGIPRVGYDLWIKPLIPIKLEDNVAYFTHEKGDFHAKITMEHYHDIICRSFAETVGFTPEIVITAEKDSTQDGQGSEDASGTNDPADSPAEPKGSYEYSFDNYIVGRSNEFAHAAAKAVASTPGGAYNPLFIYGPSGVGKTHLLRAIANELEHGKGLKVIYVTGEIFTVELIDSIQHNDTMSFKKKYRNADVLLMDDIQFISGKESTQEEFFHTFNELFTHGKQIVLSSDRPPKDIKTLEDRIRTRFEQGLIADIQSPDYETRIAVIKRKCKLLSLDLSEEVTDYIATRLSTNMRQLEGCVKKLKAYEHLMNTAPQMAQAQNAVREILSDTEMPDITTEDIISRVAAVFSVTPEEIHSNSRSQNITLARSVSCYVLSKITGMSLQEIGAEFGKNHSTVSYYISQVEMKMNNDRIMKDNIEDIIRNLKQNKQ